VPAHERLEGGLVVLAYTGGKLEVVGERRVCGGGLHGNSFMKLSAISYQRNRATFHVLVADGCSSTLSEEQMHGTPGAFPDPAAAPISLSSRRR
jgi:hypothetical protein